MGLPEFHARPTLAIQLPEFQSANGTFDCSLYLMILGYRFLDSLGTAWETSDSFRFEISPFEEKDVQSILRFSRSPLPSHGEPFAGSLFSKGNRSPWLLTGRRWCC
jgi:hypothetical protein